MLTYSAVHENMSTVYRNHQQDHTLKETSSLTQKLFMKLNTQLLWHIGFLCYGNRNYICHFNSLTGKKKTILDVSINRCPFLAVNMFMNRNVIPAEQYEVGGSSASHMHTHTVNYQVNII